LVDIRDTFREKKLEGNFDVVATIKQGKPEGRRETTPKIEFLNNLRKKCSKSSPSPNILREKQKFRETTIFQTTISSSNYYTHETMFLFFSVDEMLFFHVHEFRYSWPR